MSRWLWLVGLALCGVTDATAQPRIDLTATPAWSGWSRAGRETEIDVRVSAGAATRATLDVESGRRLVHADLDLQPGRTLRLQVPIESAEEVVVRAGAAAAPEQRHDLRIAQSEAPLLGAALASAGAVRLEGFHTIALAADDLPRNASAYASVDALVLDSPTLAALDRRQLGALLAHAAQCGRIVLLNPDPGVRRVMEGAGGCGGRAVMNAASPAEAAEKLTSSLATNLAPALSLVSVRDLASPGRATWNRALVLVAAYFAVAALTFVFSRSALVPIAVSAFATVAIVALLQLLPPPAQLVVWSESDSRAQFARYRAWQLFEGSGRGRTHVAVPPQLASPQPCDGSQPIRFDYDAEGGRLAFAEFETRLFRPLPLCFSGMLPIERAIAVDARADGSLAVENSGPEPWPAGALLAAGVAHALPALGPGESAIIDTERRKPLGDAATRVASEQIVGDRVAALWELQPSDVGQTGIEWKGWLLLTARGRAR